MDIRINGLEGVQPTDAPKAAGPVDEIRGLLLDIVT